MRKGKFSYARALSVIILLPGFVVLLNTDLIAADTLEKVKKNGVLVAGVKDATPGFGFVDEKTGELTGYDVDFVKAIANRLGVKIKLVPVTSANRIQKLKEGSIDIIAATMTKTPERARQIDFSYIYFVSGQKFLVRKGTFKSLSDLDGKKIGTVKGSTSEENARKILPKAEIITFDDYPGTLLALQEGKIFAITSDEAILANLQAKASNKEQYEIPDIQIYDEPYGMGVRKGDKKFLKAINKILLDMEKRKEAKNIFDKWFGQHSHTPINRGTFRITADQ